jgi:hypothetical protein
MNATAIRSSMIILGLIALIGSPAARAAGDKQVSTPPLGDSSQMQLSWDGVDTLSWYYVSTGDYNQDSEVSLPDVTVVGIHFKETGPFDFETAQGVVDADNNGEINGADLVNIARYMGSRVIRYNVYSSLDEADYPESNGGPNGGGATKLGAVLFEDGTGGATTRRQFAYTVGAPQAGAYYWVRPVDSDSVEGTPSTLAGGPEPGPPVLALTNPPFGGEGTSSNPYIADIDVDYVFSLTDPLDGDVSTDPLTVYTVSNPAAGSISNTDATLNIENDFAGPFNVTATYDGEPNDPATTVYMFVLPIPPG